MRLWGIARGLACSWWDALRDPRAGPEILTNAAMTAGNFTGRKAPLQQAPGPLPSPKRKNQRRITGLFHGLIEEENGRPA